MKRLVSILLLCAYPPLVFADTIYFKNGQTIEGKLIDYKTLNLDLDLPNIFGNFSKKDFISFFNIITESKLDYNEIKDIFFFKSGRWDIKTKSGILLKLPKNEIKIALDKAQNIIKNLEINYKVIDLRIANQVILSNE